MYALRIRDRRSVLPVTGIAAALAIIVSLALATNLSGLNSGPLSSAGPRPSVPSVTRVSRLLTRDSLTVPLGGPIHLPWPSADRSAPPVR
jgi:hypothetical protein